MIEWLTLNWEWFKDWLSATVHLNHLALHVVVGMLLFLAAAALFRWRLSSPKPLLVVMMAEAANELLDYTRYARAHWPWERNTTLIEVALTLAGPLIVMLVAAIATAWRGRATGKQH